MTYAFSGLLGHRWCSGETIGVTIRTRWSRTIPFSLRERAGWGRA